MYILCNYISKKKYPCICMITKDHLISLAELTHPKTNMAIENTLFEEVFPIENRDFHCHVSFGSVYFFLSDRRFFVVVFHCSHRRQATEDPGKKHSKPGGSDSKTRR